MTTAAHSARRPVYSRVHVDRSRGAISGVLLVLLGIWGGLIPFIGPIFGYAYTPDRAWQFTMGRLWLEILPAIATVLGGLMLLASADRRVTIFGGWLAAVAGAWFAVGPTLSRLFNGGVAAAGSPASAAPTQAALEEIGFFIGLGVVIVFLAALGLGRHSVVSVKDVEQAEMGRRRRVVDPDDVEGEDDDLLP
ncbi:hypothetical protein N864_09305 [Intrasporangium chromatireducens Q5-1]|uniref:Uncharacterized protein n=1 Tax=Intrasporangium chromatireducens Q5-1 TaxID=584657 RepID=W9GMB2_9MICO|nr:hypothetical protein [Intrasporangium chromatireducens]EWT07245.1 hypothetical protein N864_09305 [Intrasporangium chromatireducens Q5-1]